MSFGSFWGGIMLIQLNPDTGERIAPDSPIYKIAHYDSIEAPPHLLPRRLLLPDAGLGHVLPRRPQHV